MNSLCFCPYYNSVGVQALLEWWSDRHNPQKNESVKLWSSWTHREREKERDRERGREREEERERERNQREEFPSLWPALPLGSLAIPDLPSGEALESEMQYGNWTPQCLHNPCSDHGEGCSVSPDQRIFSSLSFNACPMVHGQQNRSSSAQWR